MVNQTIFDHFAGIIQKINSQSQSFPDLSGTGDSKNGLYINGKSGQYGNSNGNGYKTSKLPVASR